MILLILILKGMISKHKIGSNPWTLLGVSQKQTNKKIKEMVA